MVRVERLFILFPTIFDRFDAITQVRETGPRDLLRTEPLLKYCGSGIIWWAARIRKTVEIGYFRVATRMNSADHCSTTLVCFISHISTWRASTLLLATVQELQKIS